MMNSKEVLTNILSRRSIRNYSDKQVSETDLHAILKAAVHAPSGMNYQTWHFTAIQNAEKLVEFSFITKCKKPKTM